MMTVWRPSAFTITPLYCNAIKWKMDRGWCAAPSVWIVSCCAFLRYFQMRPCVFVCEKKAAALHQVVSAPLCSPPPLPPILETLEWLNSQWGCRLEPLRDAHVMDNFKQICANCGVLSSCINRRRCGTPLQRVSA